MTPPSTHLSILRALKDPRQRDAGWQRFQSDYEATILHWCQRKGLQHADAQDVTQAVLKRLWQVLPNHDHDPSRSFRGWLKAVVGNAVSDLRRAVSRRPGDRGVGGSAFLDRLTDLESPESVSDLAEATSQVGRDLDAAVARVQARVGETTWQAFWRKAVEGKPAAEVAEQLGLSAGAVYQAAYRVRDLLADECRSAL